MQPDWEQFKSQTKKEITTFLQSTVNPSTAKHILSDLFKFEPEGKFDLFVTLRIIRSNRGKREASVARLMAFLWLYEIEYVQCLDVFCYLLISNGHDLFHTIRNKYVKSLNDVGRVDVYTKLNFLEEHGFGLLRRSIDMELRNKIAHHDFVIDDSGKTLVANKEVDVGARFEDLLSFDSQVYDVFSSFLNIDV
jgi:hypothetical protein